jgi:hypothetical protein
LWRDSLFWLSLALTIFAIAPFLQPGYFWGANDARHHVYFLFEYDRLVQDGAVQPRVMALSVHPYITGVPHRIGYFEQLLDAVLAQPKAGFMTGEQIAAWYKAQVSAPQATRSS